LTVSPEKQALAAMPPVQARVFVATAEMEARGSGRLRRMASLPHPDAGNYGGPRVQPVTPQSSTQSACLAERAINLKARHNPFHRASACKPFDGDDHVAGPSIVSFARASHANSATLDHHQPASSNSLCETEGGPGPLTECDRRRARPRGDRVFRLVDYSCGESWIRSARTDAP